MNLSWEERQAAKSNLENVGPFSIDAWIEWIEDEIRTATSRDEKSDIIKLCDRSVEDFKSVRIWTVYAKFAVEDYNQYQEIIAEMPDYDELPALDVEGIRDLFRRGLTDIGYHITDSSSFWNMFREFEESILENSSLESKESQIKRLRELYLRRLELPHADVADTFSAYSNFESRYDNQNYESNLVTANRIFQKTQVYVDKLEKYERAIASTEQNPTPPVISFYSYIDYLKQIKADTFLIKTTYERALIHWYSDCELWSDYIGWMKSSFPNSKTILSLTLRAHRFCPFSSSIVNHYARALEKYPSESSDDTISHIYETSVENEAIKTNLEELIGVLMGYLDYVKRKNIGTTPNLKDIGEIPPLAKQKIREGITWAKDVMQQSLPETPDPYYRLAKYEISVESFLSPTEPAITEAIYRKLTTPTAPTSIWLEYVQWAYSHHPATKIRNLFKRPILGGGVSDVDYISMLWDEWLRWERLHGDLDSVEAAVDRYQTWKRKQTAAYAVAAAATNQESYYYGEYATTGIADGQNVPQQTSEPVSENLAPQGTKRKLEEDEEGDGRKKAKTEEEKESKEAKLDRLNRTLMFRNLEIEDDDEWPLQKFFYTYGEVNSIRLVRDDKGVCKKYGFVEFSSVEPTFNLLQNKQSVEFRDKPMFLCRPKGSNLPNNGNSLTEEEWEAHLETFRKEKEEKKKIYSEAEQEGRVVFAANLGGSITEEDIKHLVKTVNQPIEIRIMTTKTGESKGYGFITFDKAEHAISVAKLSGSTVKGRAITLAISNPALRKTEDQHYKLKGTRVRDFNPCLLYAVNLPFNINEEKVRKAFGKFGDIKEVRLPMQNGRPKGIAFVEYLKEESAQAALSLNETIIYGRPVKVKISEPTGKAEPPNRKDRVNKGDERRQLPSDKATYEEKGTSQGQQSTDRNGRVRQHHRPEHRNTRQIQQPKQSFEVHVTNLPEAITETELKDLFSKAGEVLSVKLRRTDQSGHAFVKVKDEGSASRLCLDLSGTQLHDKVIEVTATGSSISASLKPRQARHPRVKNVPKRRPGLGFTEAKKGTEDMDVDEPKMEDKAKQEIASKSKNNDYFKNLFLGGK
ncbi:hypothetical protein BKA69DRAFT_1126432 [Paraphysoderma sedebokerense]|nr:hypothetical protein BKA69DRAFT_1126432 [Paraphysoderma sedebokerense]